MNVIGLQGRAIVVGFVGRDAEGEELATLLTQVSIEHHLLPIASRPTTTKLRVLGPNKQQMLRIDVEQTAPAPEDSYRELLKETDGLLASADVLVLSDYAKGVLRSDVCAQLIERARSRGIPVIVDPKSSDFGRYAGATTVCPNLKELGSALHAGESSADELLAAAKALVSRLNLEYLTVTMSDKGIAVLRSDGIFRAPAAAKEVYDVSGAGDTVIAVLALACSCDVPIEAAAQLANQAAGIVVSKVGTVAVQHNELLDVLLSRRSTRTETKIVELAELLLRVAEWKTSGERIVFTNGCYDLLHVGHVSLLEHCRRMGSRVIVGLNSDDSVRKLKGASRPVLRQDDRAQLLAALSATDAVVLFDEDTPLRLIQAIRPDVLVKGGDYAPDTVVGADVVRSYGGEVVIVPTIEGASTTGIVRKLTQVLEHTAE
jgi:D-beta-D-heptose 7-phosphate kinase/D-beta-D-heptose 1-phosphate adenosyltransferase